MDFPNTKKGILAEPILNTMKNSFSDGNVFVYFVRYINGLSTTCGLNVTVKVHANGILIVNPSVEKSISQLYFST